MKIRSGRAGDIAVLEAMLLEAFFWNAGAERPPLEAFRRDPELTKLLGAWGRTGDRALIGEANSTPIAPAPAMMIDPGRLSVMICSS